LGKEEELDWTYSERGRLMKLVLELKARGRPRMGMIDDLVEESYGVMKRRAENRDDWREF